MKIGQLAAVAVLLACSHSYVAAASVTATKTVSGPFTVGSMVTYTIVMTNNGPDDQPNNPGDEFIDVLPAGVTLNSAVATSGIAIASVGANTVTWNGPIVASGSVTLTIAATVNPGAAGTIVANQGTVAFDTGQGVNDASGVTDDPGVAGAANPTNFAIAALPVVSAPTAVPTLSNWTLMGLLSLVAMLGLARMRSRTSSAPH